MRIVQTFWTAGRDPMQYSFGWLHPEYNLMSWALSCLSLREHYDEVALYTDEQGKHVLIDLLHLPYTEVHVVYDEYLCLPQHWAYAKIKTYSLQDKPFLHVDGDVYLPKPIPDEIISAPLIAQNREIGTRYYQQMVGRIMSYPEIILPDFIEEGLAEDSVASYNMGLFGGNDLAFIQQYCQEVLRFMSDNHMNDVTFRCSRVWCNILFEQIFLAVLTDRDHIDVKCLNRPMQDEGYTHKEFCNFEQYEQACLLHILGGHKQKEFNSEMLGRTLLRLYPDYFERIFNLIPQKFVTTCRSTNELNLLSTERGISQYEDFLELLKGERIWQDKDALFRMESRISNYVQFVMADRPKRHSVIIERNPFMRIFHIPSNWHPKAIEMTKNRLRCEQQFPLSAICLRPSFFNGGVVEIPIVDIQREMLDFIHNNQVEYKQLESEFLGHFTLRSTASLSGARKLIVDELIQLLRNGVLLIQIK